jgi:L-cystine transport system permease protein
VNFQFGYFLQCLWNAVKFVPTTLYIATWTLCIGFVFGTAIAILRTHRIKVLSPILDFCMVVMKAIPVNLLIIAVSLIFTTQFNRVAEGLHLSFRVRDVNVVYIAIFAFSFFSTTVISENVRGALLSISKGQYEAGYTVGLTNAQTFRRIIFPQLLLVLLPTLTGTIISMIKATSLVILLGVVDILNGALKFANTAYCFFEAYLAAALVYWVFSLLIQLAGMILEKRLGKGRGVLT